MTDRIITIYESEWQDRYEQGQEDAVEKIAHALADWITCERCPVYDECNGACEKHLLPWMEEVVKDDE